MLQIRRRLVKSKQWGLAECRAWGKSVIVTDCGGGAELFVGDMASNMKVVLERYHVRSRCLRWRYHNWDAHRDVDEGMEKGESLSVPSVQGSRWIVRSKTESAKGKG